MWYRCSRPLEVRDGERLVPIGGRQQQRVLAVLLAEGGRSVGTDRLIEVLWPDGLAPAAAQHTVLTYVHRLRAALDDGSVSRSARVSLRCLGRRRRRHPLRAAPRAGGRRRPPPRRRALRPGPVDVARPGLRQPGRRVVGARVLVRLDELRVAPRGPGDGHSRRRARTLRRFPGSRRSSPNTRSVSARSASSPRPCRRPGGRLKRCGSCKRCVLVWPMGRGSTPPRSCGSWSTRSPPDRRPRGRAAAGHCAATSSTMRSARVRSAGCSRRRSPAQVGRSPSR